jgi:branched-chain amino acid transport system permease protein
MLLEQTFNGLGIGCTYALIALGYVLQFSVLKITNLSFGEIFMVSSFAAVLFAANVSSNLPLVLLAAIGTAMLLGLLIHLVAVRPLGNVSDVDSPRHLAVLISTIGVSVILQNAALELFGSNPLPFPRLVPAGSFPLGAVRLDLVVVLNLALSLAVMLALFGFLYFSTLGIRIRAIAENRSLALCLGVHADRDETYAILVSSALAGIAAVLIGQVIGATSPFVGLSYGLKGLVVLVAAGMSGMVRAVAVALLLGLSEALAVAYLSSSYRDASAFAVLVLILVLREARFRFFRGG